MRQHQFDGLVSTIKAICRSRGLASYVIGRTSRSVATRLASYRRECFDHLVVIADKLTDSEAELLERRLFEACVKNRKSLLYAKYHPKKRVEAHRRSNGGGRSMVAAHVRAHSIYVAWWEA